MIDLNKIASATLAGLLAGAVIGGLGARLAMRIVALLISSQPDLTAGGTLVILILGSIVGLGAGLVFGFIRPLLDRLLPGRLWWQGLAYGGALAVLLALPFFLSREGENALLPAWQEALLFGSIALVYGLALALLDARLRARYAHNQAASVSLLWFAVFGLSLLLAFVSMASLANEVVHLPVAVVRTIRQQGWSFDVRTPHTMLAVLFDLGYCGLTAVIFWRGARDRTARFAALALLWFAAAFFNTGQVLPGAMLTLPLLRWLPGLIQALGLGGLVLLLLTFPDGRFVPPWTRLFAVLYGLWLVVWFVNPLNITGLDPQAWPDTLVALVLLGGMGLGLLAQILRYRRATHLERRQTRPVVIAFTLALTGFALVWLAQIAVPDLRGRSLSHFSGLFTFVPYLLPWLLIPVSLVYANLRRGLWSTQAPDGSVWLPNSSVHAAG